jgi:AcrR family transcriptional regulator
VRDPLTVTPTTAPSRKKQLTLAAFHRAAREVFAEKGFFNAQIADIAQRAGKSTGSFYNYYDNKQQLLEALLDHFASDILDQTRSRLTDDPAANIEEAVRAYFQTFRDYLPEMIGVFHLAMTDATFADWWRERRAEGIAAVLSVIRSVENTGRTVDLKHDMFASAMVSMLESFCWTWMVAGGDRIQSTYNEDAAVATISEIWYRAIFADARPSA